MRHKPGTEVAPGLLKLNRQRTAASEGQGEIKQGTGAILTGSKELPALGLIFLQHGVCAQLSLGHF